MQREAIGKRSEVIHMNRSVGWSGSCFLFFGVNH
jgi:hypothetical protein